MTPVGADSQLQLLAKLAAEFPERFRGFTITWEHDAAQVGVYKHQEGARVFLNNAEHDIETLAEAIDLLREIFADNVVAVTGIAAGQVAYTHLAPARDPAATLPRPSAWTSISAQRVVPDIDDIIIETWSSGIQDKG